MFFDQRAHAGAGGFVREVGCPQQAVVAHQLDVSLGRDLSAALKIQPLFFSNSLGASTVYSVKLLASFDGLSI